MKLVFEGTSNVVTVGTVFPYEQGDETMVNLTVTHIEKPRHPGSTGRVTASENGEPGWQPFFPSVYGMEWIEREDRTLDSGGRILTPNDNLGLMARIKSAQDAAAHGSGQSDVLYESRLQDAYCQILGDASAENRAATEATLRENGFDPDCAPFEAQEGECDLTGIDAHCCPCGRHE